MTELARFVEKVALMRTSQKEYFKLAAMAKQKPSLHADKKNVLELSKHIEKEVDAMVLQLTNDFQLLSQDAKHVLEAFKNIDKEASNG